MSKRCAKCEKTVYPAEELKCLDKSWHKGCFKCHHCNMTLNMKNYKGYDKIPYCNAHYPQTKHTIVADTPEQRRISENTKIQSSVHYKSEYEKSKSDFTIIPDDLSLLREMQNSKNISTSAYHKEFNRTKSQCRQIPDSVEMKTLSQNSLNFSTVQYKSDYERTKSDYTPVADDLNTKRVQKNKASSMLNYKKDYNQTRFHHLTKAEAIRLKEEGLQGNDDPRLVKYHAEFEKMKGKKTSVADDPEARRVKHNTEIQSNIAYHDVKGQRNSQEARRPAEQVEAGRVRTNPGRIADYNAPEESASGTQYTNRNSQAKQVYDSNIGAESDQVRRGSRNSSVRNRVDRFSSSDDDARFNSSRISRHSYSESQKNPRYSSSMDQPSSRKVGSISDYDPLNEQFGANPGGQPQRGDSYAAAQPKQPPPQQPYQPAPPKFNPPPPQQPRDPYAGKGMVVKAIYDYQAGDGDEVTFNDGDTIIMCQKIDDGWMEGTVERSGQRGMLPSNYVEALN